MTREELILVRGLSTLCLFRKVFKEGIKRNLLKVADSLIVRNEFSAHARKILPSKRS